MGDGFVSSDGGHAAVAAYTIEVDDHQPLVLRLI
jgi:hypothetical protein